MAVRLDEAIRPVLSLFGLLYVPFAGWVLERLAPLIPRQKCSCAVSLSLACGHLMTTIP
ncbi:hypothetical protein BD769DRAFT_1774068 [Suillus cothurnatus]|jgi:hypothetical protein|nr:hypothetical protein BD769DRAFT_1774068 [Suillus cothurnatus]